MTMDINTVLADDFSKPFDRNTVHGARLAAFQKVETPQAPELQIEMQHTMIATPCSPSPIRKIVRFAVDPDSVTTEAKVRKLPGGAQKTMRPPSPDQARILWYVHTVAPCKEIIEPLLIHMDVTISLSVQNKLHFYKNAVYIGDSKDLDKAMEIVLTTTKARCPVCKYNTMALGQAQCFVCQIAWFIQGQVIVRKCKRKPDDGAWDTISNF